MYFVNLHQIFVPGQTAVHRSRPHKPKVYAAHAAVHAFLERLKVEGMFSHYMGVVVNRQVAP